MRDKEYLEDMPTFKKVMETDRIVRLNDELLPGVIREWTRFLIKQRQKGFIISATPYKDLRRKYDDGTWDREKFADAHILFFERGEDYDYMERIFTEQLTKHSLCQDKSEVLSEFL